MAPATPRIRTETSSFLVSCTALSDLARASATANRPDPVILALVALGRNKKSAGPWNTDCRPRRVIEPVSAPSYSTVTDSPSRGKMARSQPSAGISNASCLVKSPIFKPVYFQLGVESFTDTSQAPEVSSPFG